MKSCTGAVLYSGLITFYYLVYSYGLLIYSKDIPTC